MAFTNRGLVEHCKKCLNLKTKYMWGSFGNEITESFISQKAKQYPSRYDESRISFLKAHIGEYAADCVGLIKWYLMGGIGNAKYISKYDKNVSGFLNSCSETGDISSMPEIIGLGVFMSGHIGIYIGNGEVIEATFGSFGDGVVKTKLSARKWTKWGMLGQIEYVDSKSEEKLEEESVSGKKKIVTPTVGLWLKQSAATTAKGILVMPKGAEVISIKENVANRNGYKWDYVQYKDFKGYCANKYLSEVKTTSYTKMTVSPSAGLYYHSNIPPSAKTQMGIWKKGTEVQVLNGYYKKYGKYTWVKILYNGKTVYAAKDFLN